jgi:hypothetical protein
MSNNFDHWWTVRLQILSYSWCRDPSAPSLSATQHKTCFTCLVLTRQWRTVSVRKTFRLLIASFMMLLKITARGTPTSKGMKINWLRPRSGIMILISRALLPIARVNQMILLSSATGMSFAALYSKQRSWPSDMLFLIESFPPIFLLWKDSRFRLL